LLGSAQINKNKKKVNENPINLWSSSFTLNNNLSQAQTFKKSFINDQTNFHTNLYQFADNKKSKRNNTSLQNLIKSINKQPMEKSKPKIKTKIDPKSSHK
jgi:hypothetical protein